MKRARDVECPMPAVATLRRPLWRSLASAVAWQIAIGRLPAGRRLPSTRTLARQLRLSRNTVALAFEVLVADGYLASRVGDGTYVLGQADWRHAPVWLRTRRWVRDADGLLLWITT
jgi:GntR family transcriptional regulator / MocR family aminotransferase